MTPEKWQKFKAIVVELMTLEQTEWPERLVAECGDDVDLFLDASAMLAASRSLGDFIEAPAWRGLLGSSDTWRPRKGTR